VNPPLRTVGAIAVAAALLAQTWLWIGVMGAPIGYTVDDRVSTLTDTQFFLGGFPGDLSPSGNMTIRADAHHFEQDWPLRSTYRKTSRRTRSSLAEG